MREESQNLESETRDAIARLVRLAGPRTQAPPESSERARRVVRSSWQRAVRRRRLRRVSWVGGGSLAAAAMLALIFFGTAPQAVPDPVPIPGLRAGEVERVDGIAFVIEEEGASRAMVEGLELREGEVLETGIEDRLALRLDTGHSVRLDRDSRVRLETATLLRLERGAVYVDSRQAKDPVEVVTDRGRIEELGTQFEVRLEPAGLRVRVREGSIQLDGDEDVAAGSQVVVDGDGRRMRSQVDLHGPEWQWAQQIAPVFELEGSTLEDFLHWASRETGRRLEFGDSAIGRDADRVQLHGDLDEISPEQSLAAVLPTCGLRHRLVGDRLRIEESF